MGTLVSEMNKNLYSFFNADQVMDFLVSISVRPFVELSFMPETLASGSTKVFSYQANVTPPKNYRQWEELIHKLASHWVERYGLDEVREWFFEVWNEPNLKAFWTGTQKDYFKLYQITARALKRVDPLLKVGGPATAKNAWIPEFLEFCEKPQSPGRFRKHPSLSDRRLRQGGRGYAFSIAARATSRDARRCKDGSGVRRKACRSITPSGISPRTHAMRFMMSLSPQPTRPKLSLKLKDW